MNYRRLSTDADLSEASLGEAALMVGPSFLYDLHVSLMTFWSAKRLLKAISADTQDNPMAPYVNLVLDPDVDHFGWFLVANGKAAGSPGV